ncbi:uncharacterized protein LOC116966787 [Amblyraja radiata]|uniref:uncharacterized protein LOC116966787 n=1 Tax=Amblyraja radiata TaxID=386614 RepID=UPI001403BB0C|nr:uncharacterized protein LOC116966787 [Amblyraja radiata]
MAPSEFSGMIFVVSPRACLKFQANVFDRSRCQNCFKPFDLHRRDCGRGDNQLQYGGLGPDQQASALNQGDVRLASPGCSLCCRTISEEVTASWQVGSRMHSHLSGYIARKWAEESTPWVSPLPSGAGTRGHTSRGEWTLGSSAPQLRGESRDKDTHADNSAWLQSRSRTNSVGSRGMDVVSVERVAGRKARVESGYFSLERAKSDSVHGLCPAAGVRAGESRGGPSSSPTTAPGLLNLGRLTSSQSSFESETSWGTAASAGSSDHRASRRDYSALADIPKTKRISGRDKLEQDCKQLAPRARNRSPGREEVDRLFGQERRPVSETYREFAPGTAGGTGREATASHRLDEESRTSKVYPRKFQQKETEREIPQQPFSSLLKSKMRDPPTSAKYDRPDRGLTKQVSSFSMTSKDKHRFLTQQHDKVDTKTYSHKDEVKMCTKCSRVASDINKADRKFSKEDSSSYSGYLQSAAKMDNRFPSPEQSAHSGYQRSTAKRDQVETSFPERTPHPAYVRAFSRSDRVDAGISSLEEQKPYTGYLTRSDRVPLKLNSIEESSSCVGYHKTSLAERGFSTRGNSATPNKDVYPQTADKHEKTERGFPNRPTSNSLHKDLRQQAANKDSKTDRGVSLRSNVDSPGKDVYPQTTTRLEKTDRGFSNRPTLNSPNKELYSPTPDKPNKIVHGNPMRSRSPPHLPRHQIFQKSVVDPERGLPAATADRKFSKEDSSSYSGYCSRRQGWFYTRIHKRFQTT